MQEQQTRRISEQLVADFATRSLPQGTPRRTELPGLPHKADVVVGMRRVGKTRFVFQQIHKHLARGIERDRLLYLNFEDERLLPLDASQLHQLTEAFYRRYPASRDLHCWFYFDEIQNVPGWERFIRRQLDSEQVSVVLTGSSARLLSREIATSLRGRSLAQEILPFSFAEALEHAGQEIPDRWPPPSKHRSRLEKAFDRYLEAGGFPEVQEVTPELRLRILQDYVNVVLFRDIAERHGVENLTALRQLERSLLANPAGRFSINRLHNDLKSQGLKAGKDSLYQYLDYLEDAYLLFTVPIASSSVRVRQTNPRKCYPIDPALSAAVSFSASRDVGHRLESLVYLELRRRSEEVAYYKTDQGHEVDFLTLHHSGRQQLIQVCAEMTRPETRKRELRALQEAMAERDLDQALLISMFEEETIELEGRVVEVIPAWRWLLQDD